MLAHTITRRTRQYLSKLRKPPAAPPAPPAGDAEAYERLIWEEKSHELAARPLTDPASWAGAFQHDLVHFAARPLHTPTQPAPAYLAAAVVMMVKDEADIIGENLLWLYRTGLRRFVILDNASSDETADIIGRFRKLHDDVELLTVYDPIVRYMQAEKTTGLFRLAFSVWPDLRWVLPIDADEFLIAERGLAILDTVVGQTDALTIPKVVHFRRQGAVPSGRSVMEDMDYRSPLSFVPPKVIMRPNPLATITQGNHQVRCVDQRAVVYDGGLRHGLYYREFPNRSFAHFLRKVCNGGTAIRASEAYLGHRVGGWHWVDYHDAFTSAGEGRLRDIYDREYVRRPSPGFVSDPFSVDARALALP